MEAQIGAHGSVRWNLSCCSAKVPFEPQKCRERGLLGLSGGANIIHIGFQYYVNTVSLPTQGRTLGNRCW